MSRNLVSILVFASAAMFAVPSFGQNAALVDAAKKQGGKVVVYGSLEGDTFDAVAKQFEKQTGLSVEYWRASATKVMDRVLTEYRSGKPLFDIVLTNDTPMRIMEKNAVF